MATNDFNDEPHLKRFTWHRDVGVHAGVSAESHAYLASCALDFARGVEAIMDIVHQDDALAEEDQRHYWM